MPQAHDPSPYHCLHSPKLPLMNPKDTRLGQTRGGFGVLRHHTSRLHLTLRFYPHGFTIFPGCVPGLPVLSHRPIPSSTPYPPPLTLSPSDLCVSSVSSFLKNGVSSGFTLAASRGIHGSGPVHGGTLNHYQSITSVLL